MTRLTVGLAIYLAFEAVAGPLVIRFVTWPALHALATAFH
jgi:hypothetical protein